jgi:hypothetical protein
LGLCAATTTAIIIIVVFVVESARARLCSTSRSSNVP